MKDDNGVIKKVLAPFGKCQICPASVQPRLNHPPALCPFRPSGPLANRANWPSTQTDISETQVRNRVKNSAPRKKIKLIDKLSDKITGKRKRDEESVGNEEVGKNRENLLLTPTQVNLLEMAKYSEISATSYMLTLGSQSKPCLLYTSDAADE